MNDCQQAMQQLWDYLDEELTEERMVAIRQHLTICQGCYPHYDFERTFLEAIASTRSLCRPPAELRQRVLNCLEGAGWGKSAKG